MNVSSTLQRDTMPDPQRDSDPPGRRAATRGQDAATALRRRIGDLMGEPEPPPVLSVVNTMLSDVMAGPQPGPSLEHGNNFDWILALGDKQLGLVRVPPGRPMSGELIAAPLYHTLRVSVLDHGELDRRRMFLLTMEDGTWIALGTRIRPRRVAQLDDFTDALLARTSG